MHVMCMLLRDAVLVCDVTCTCCVVSDDIERHEHAERCDMSCAYDDLVEAVCVTCCEADVCDAMGWCGDM